MLRIFYSWLPWYFSDTQFFWAVDKLNKAFKNMFFKSFTAFSMHFKKKKIQLFSSAHSSMTLPKPKNMGTTSDTSLKSRKPPKFGGGVGCFFS